MRDAKSKTGTTRSSPGQNAPIVGRRQILQQTGLGALLLAQLPERWQTPVVRSLLLPAHAMFSMETMTRASSGEQSHIRVRTTVVPTTTPIPEHVTAEPRIHWNRTTEIMSSGLTTWKAISHSVTDMTLTVHNADSYVRPIYISGAIYVGAGGHPDTDSAGHLLASDFSASTFIWTWIAFIPTTTSGRIVFGVFDANTETQLRNKNRSNDTFALTFYNAAPAVNGPTLRWNRTNENISDRLTIGTKTTYPLTNITVTITGEIDKSELSAGLFRSRALVPKLDVVRTSGGTVDRDNRNESFVRAEFEGNDTFAITSLTFTPIHARGSIVLGLFYKHRELRYQLTNDNGADDAFTLTFDNAVATVTKIKWNRGRIGITRGLIIGDAMTHTIPEQITVTVTGATSPAIEVKAVAGKIHGATFNQAITRQVTDNNGMITITLTAVKFTPNEGNGRIWLGIFEGNQQLLNSNGKKADLLIRFRNAKAS